MQKFVMMLKSQRTVANIICLRLFSVTRVPMAAPKSNDPDDLIEMENPYEEQKHICILCENDISPNYKNVKLLSQFQSPYTGRIYGRHITGLCSRKQEEVEKAIVRAQNCALMPTYHKDTDFLQDPNLFNPEKPIRPHKY